MSNKNITNKHSIIKSFLIAFVIIAGLLAITVVGFGLIGLPGWPFCFFLFYYLTFAHIAKVKLLDTAIGGFIGLTVGFSPGILSALIGIDGIGWLITIILLIVLVTIVVDGRIKVIDPLCMMMVTTLTGYGLQCNTAPELYLPSVGSYAIAVVGFAIVVKVVSKHAKKESVKRAVE